ncbi:MAG: thioredoxin family protein [Rubrivivax sp.]|nr:thioredoxin family protein [Rubrivivax sp.]
MKSRLAATVLSSTLAATLALAAAPALAASVGQPAPAFTAVDTSGKTVSLADFKGRHVVLEWVNPGCPYVRRHYDSANMQGTQKDAAAKGAVWLTINSTAEDSGDYMQPAALQQWMSTHKAAATHTLMDADGKVGRAYGARTTPHMYVINPAGTLVYAGAIDDQPRASVADTAKATNHVKAALAESTTGKAVTVATTRAYGCSIKYSSM